MNGHGPSSVAWNSGIRLPTMLVHFWQASSPRSVQKLRDLGLWGGVCPSNRLFVVVVEAAAVVVEVVVVVAFAGDHHELVRAPAYRPEASSESLRVDKQK